MDSFELNKILGALLGTCLVLLAVHIASGAIFAPPIAAKPGYVIEVKQEQPGGKEGGPAPAQQVPFDTLLASASPQRGAQIARQCELCHNLGKGQGTKIGPDLYGVVGRDIASEPGFNYSAALKAKKGKWTFDTLNPWIANPRADVPGTAMTFAGISNEKQRADLVAYLNSNSDNPLPLPTAAQAQPAAGNPSASAGTPPQAANPAPNAPAGGGSTPPAHAAPGGPSAPPGGGSAPAK